MALEAGSRLGPYEILAPLGSGGMSEVYRARDPRLGREVALKVLREEIADRSRLRRFEQEARAAGALNHPNILAVHDVGSHAGAPYLVSELLEGHTLRTRLENGALPGKKAADYALQIVHGLAAAHAKGIVHRDLKPDNVFVTEDGRVKILDFGLAKLARSGPFAHTHEHTADETTEAGVVLGTVGFMSPEQVRGEEVDHRSDIFSFGAVLYQMLSGQRAFRRDTAAETMTAILKEDPPDLTTIEQAISPGLARIVERCLEKRAGDRFQSAHDLALALEVASSGEFQATVEGRGAASAPAIGTKTGLKKAPLVMWAAVGIAVVGVYWAFLHTPEPTSGAALDSTEPFEITPFTSDGGYKSQPQLSPHGDKVLYRWGGPTRDNFDIYVKALGVGARALRLTEHPGEEGLAVWSPDELQIAFIRATDEGGAGAIYVMPSLGGQERKLIDISGQIMTHSHVFVPKLSWSPDGDWLALSEKATVDEPARIVRLSLATLEKQPLTTPPPGSEGDFDPSLSPDGKQLAFVRLSSSMASDLWVQALEGGEARRVTFGDYAGCGAISWTSDGGDLLFTAGTSGRSARILRVSLAGGRPQPIPGLGEGATGASVRGERMVYQQVTGQRTDIWRVPGRGAASADRVPEQLIISSGVDQNPAHSPDGLKLAFNSNRRGAWDIWVSDSDGSNPIQLTDLPGEASWPRWAPNSRQIVFGYTETEGEGSNLYAIDAEGGVPRRLTQGTSGNSFGSWSHDGRWIYFGSDRSGRLEIWKIPAEGGEAVRITQGGGWRPEESWDGRHLYYYNPGTDSSVARSSIWRAPVEGGTETEVVGGTTIREWALSRSGLYYSTLERFAGFGTPVYTIQFLDLASGEEAELFRREDRISRWCLEVSPDEEWILYERTPPAQSELMLVESFR